MMVNQQSSAALSQRVPMVQEYSIRLPKKKKHMSCMRFNANLKVDPAKWKGVKLHRENNSAAYKNTVEEQPKFGAGSAYGQEAREEARRKKFGGGKNKYSAENQPWILKTTDTQKAFRGLRDGGINENSVYYVFVTGEDGSIEAHRLDEWYSFQPIQRYRTLNDEEAEEEFNRRQATYNYFNLMARKKARSNEEADEEPGEAEAMKKGPKKKADLMVSEMEDWINSSDSDDDDDVSDKKMSNKKAATKKKKNKKKNKDSDDEALEESDDGDDEGREKEYISDSSESESELEKMGDLKSVDQEDGLRKQLVSDDDSEDEEEKEEEKMKEDQNSTKKEESSSDNGSCKEIKKAAKISEKSVEPKSKKLELSSGPSSPDSENSCDKKLTLLTSADVKTKRKTQEIIDSVKRRKIESIPLTKSNISNDVLTDSAVRKYLERKPITITELLQKFKKKTGLSSDQLAERITDILVRLKPKNRVINDKKYFSL